MTNNKTLQEQLQRLGLTYYGQTPSSHQWTEALGHIERAMVEAESRRALAEAALKQYKIDFRAWAEHASDSFYVSDFEGRILDANQRACDSLGYERSELLGMTLSDIDVGGGARSAPPREPIGAQNLPSDSTPVAAEAFESRYRCKDGRIFPVEVRATGIALNGRNCLLTLVRDLTGQIALQEQIRHIVYHDPLTSLPNRALFNRRLSLALAEARPHRRRLALLVIDLDRFKVINDTLGHDAGDRLLQEMARRLQAALPPMAFLARLGGDEFGVLLENIADAGQANATAEAILAALVEAYALDSQQVYVTASIGIGLYPEDGADELTLLQHADVAMYRAKAAGKNNFQFYASHPDLYSKASLALESSLRHAIDDNQLLLHYQPKVETGSERIIGMEVLVRWQHPELGLLLPEDFIPLAEETGLIVPLTRWVLGEACRQHGIWVAEGLPALKIAVNISARQFADARLLTDVTDILAETGMDPRSLELEITESMMMQNAGKTREQLNALRAMGIQIAIDDFGLGYSSLSHLKQLPVDIIKIDRSFISQLPGDNTDVAITNAIIALAKCLHIAVVAEGVELAEQFQFLRTTGCDAIQGYFFSRPVSAADFAHMLRRQNGTTVG